MTLIHIVAALMWVIPSSFFLLNHVKYFGLIQPCCQVAKEIIKLFFQVFKLCILVKADISFFVNLGLY